MAGILTAVAPLQAAIQITRSTDATALATALVGGAGAGITVTSALIQSPGTGASGEKSSGVYQITASPDTYGLTKGGIVLSTGDAGDDGTASNTTPCEGFSDCLSFDFHDSASAAEDTLLDQVCSGTHKDVTELDLTFNVAADVSSLTLYVAFASDEYPTFNDSASLVDCFALFVNGTDSAHNFANANGDVFTVANPGFGAWSGTQLNGALLANNGVSTVPRIGLTIPVTPGSTGNALKLILSDKLDGSIDSAIYIEALGASPPVGSDCVFCDGFEGSNLACWSSQTGGSGGGSCLPWSPATLLLAPSRELPWDHRLPANLRVVPRN